MQMSPEVKNFFAIVNYLNTISLPNNEQIRCYYDDDNNFVVYVVGGTKEALFTIKENSSFKITVHHVETPHVTDATFWVSKSDDDSVIKDIVDELLNNHLRVNTVS